jgi:hypothetical protein
MIDGAADGCDTTMMMVWIWFGYIYCDDGGITRTILTTVVVVVVVVVAVTHHSFIGIIH